MVVGAPSLLAAAVAERPLDRRAFVNARTAAAAALTAGLVAYYAAAESLPNVSNGWDVALIIGVLIPAAFALVYLALPLRHASGLLIVGLALGALTVLLAQAGLDVAANFAKLAAMTLIAFWFLGYFESLSWVVLVAAIVPWVDAYSVFRGPTREIVEHQPEIFTALSIAFPVPGERASANLGLPDVLFFALFLGAAARFALRPGWTWLAMTASFGATTLLAIALDRAGLPALPLLCVGFLAPNADLLWRRLRTRPPEALDDTAAAPESDSADADRTGTAR